MEKEKAPYEPTGHFEKDYKEFCGMQKYPPIPLVIDRGSGGSDKTLNDKKPKIRMQLDPTSDSVLGVSIADFAIDPQLARILASAIQASTSLVSIKLWNTALTNESFGILLGGIQASSTVKHLSLEANVASPGRAPLSEDLFAELLASNLPDESDEGDDDLEVSFRKPRLNPLSSVSLRCNRISDAGAARIADALACNRHLTALSLWGNSITSRGAISIAKALRQNRTLLSLSLGHNRVGDAGIAALAEVISEFQLTHEEVVARRKLLSAQLSDDGDDPKAVSRINSIVVASPKKPAATPATMKEPKTDKKQRAPSAGKIKVPGTKDSKSAKGDKVPVKPVRLGEADPLLEPARCEGTVWYVHGNRNLVSLNVADNPFTAEGLRALVAAIRFQANIGDAGLVRLPALSASFPRDCPDYQDLEAIMASRAPNVIAVAES
eukprot:m.238600 g.238600  ORF g.238600 m.238600 type:complete len:438 (-) comp21869_c0_seq1:123-1436(-)